MEKIRHHSWLFIMIALLGVIIHMNAYAKEPTERDEKRWALAHTMADLVISTLRDTKKSDRDRKASLEHGFSNVMDIDWIAKFALGNGWRKASEEQRVRYTKLYRKYLTKVYVENYAETSDRKVTNIRVLDIDDNSDDSYIARTQVMLMDGSSMKVDYLVREKDGSNKIIDVIIEGVSLLTSHRNDFSKLAASHGVDGVITQLEQLVEKPAIQLSMK